MSERLMDLCELQLDAVLADLDSHTAEVSVAAGRLLQLCSAAASPADTQDVLLQATMEARRIATGLQFHDELAQRISHVAALLRLLREDATDATADTVDTATLLARVSAIFSSQAEFSQLSKVFPERQVDQGPALIELF